jgi:hypothetical protein
MYQQLMMEVHKQWLEEFDHEAARRRQLPRRRERAESRSLLEVLRLRRPRPAAAPRYAHAQQCT